MKLLGLFFFVAAAVIIGLAIAYWYLRRVDAERPRLHREPRVVPMPDKHRRVDLTPDASSVDAVVDQTEAAALAKDADADDPMRRREAVERKQTPVVEGSPEQEAASGDPAPEGAALGETAPISGADTGAERDDLKKISGVGSKLEQVLNENGIFRFRQIAGWQDADIDAIDEQLGSFSGRIRRDDWVGQAKKLSG